MGMYDYLRCKYPLPITGFQDRVFQTKDTPAQWLNSYEIREDGTLWNDSRQELFSGEIYFYDFNTYSGDDMGWIEFCAWFKGGIVRDIRVVTNSPPSDNDIDDGII